MRVSGKCMTIIFALLFTLCAVCAYGDEDGYWEDGDSGYSTPYASRENISIHLDKDPPYVTKPWETTPLKTFHRDGNYWVIDELPKGTIFTVPEGYKARCIAFHTKNVRGKAGRTLDNGRVIYSAGANVKYIYSSELRIYKD